MGASQPSRMTGTILYVQVQKIIQLNEYGCRDAPCEKSWKKGIPLAILSRILAQSCVTLCLNYVGRVTHDCASILDSIAKWIPCFLTAAGGTKQQSLEVTSKAAEATVVPQFSLQATGRRGGVVSNAP